MVPSRNRHATFMAKNGKLPESWQLGKPAPNESRPAVRLRHPRVGVFRRYPALVAIADCKTGCGRMIVFRSPQSPAERSVVISTPIPTFGMGHASSMR
jgi:hypothetical protein